MVTDFGLASAAGMLEGRSPVTSGVSRHLDLALTEPGTLLGTPTYMAPEQRQHLRADGRADQFSFCVALYEALYGKSPYAADTYLALRARVTKGEIEPPSPGLVCPQLGTRHCAAWVAPETRRSISIHG